MQLQYCGWCHWKEGKTVNQNPSLTQKVIFLLNTHFVRSGHICLKLLLVYDKAKIIDHTKCASKQYKNM